MRPKKRFGQVFLSEKHYIDAILSAIGAPETLIEIGPGQGAVTAGFAERAKRYAAVEIDRDCIDLLRKRFPALAFVESDFLELDLENGLPHPPPYTFAGNLPYNVAAHILLKLVRHWPIIKSVFFMVQREVGDRLVATPHHKDYSFLTVALNTFGPVKRLFLLPPGAFRPIPRVESAFLKFTVDAHPLLRIDETAPYLEFVSLAFSQRRKKLSSVLSRHYDKSKVRSAFESQLLEPNLRAEELAIEGFVRLYHALVA
ncbi:MAG: 16S rRNA (adenine(1518)-N(6)/adenine(1519)-N(6))-dimethyltransferase RsmA [Fibrobacterota bacterium]